jgi:hypothetical protein
LTASTYIFWADYASLWSYIIRLSNDLLFTKNKNNFVKVREGEMSRRKEAGE